MKQQPLFINSNQNQGRRRDYWGILKINEIIEKFFKKNKKLKIGALPLWPESLGLVLFYVASQSHAKACFGVNI